MLESELEGERVGSVDDSLMDCSLPRAPRRAQTGHGSLSSYNAVPQPGMPVWFSCSRLLRDIRVLSVLVSNSLHKIARDQ